MQSIACVLTIVGEGTMNLKSAGLRSLPANSGSCRRERVCSFDAVLEPQCPTYMVGALALGVMKKYRAERAFEVFDHQNGDRRRKTEIVVYVIEATGSSSEVM